MRDPLRTRKIFARIDRETDIYVIADRLRQAIGELDDDLDKIGKDIKILQDNERARITATGVHRIIKDSAVEGGIGIAKWMLGILGAILLAAVSAVFGRYFGK